MTAVDEACEEKETVAPLLSLLPLLAIVASLTATAGLAIDYKISSELAVFEVLLHSCFLVSLATAVLIADTSAAASCTSVERIEGLLIARREATWIRLLQPRVRQLLQTRHVSCRLLPFTTAFLVTFVSAFFTYTALLTQFFDELSRNRPFGG